QLPLGAHHAVAFDAADLAYGKSHARTRDVGAGLGEGADQARARIRRAADDLDELARAVIYAQHAQAVRVRMLLGADDLGDNERLQLGLVVDGFDLQPDHGQRFDDL